MAPRFWGLAAGLGLPGNRLPPYDYPYPRERRNGSICIFFYFALNFVRAYFLYFDSLVVQLETFNRFFFKDIFYCLLSPSWLVCI